MFTLITGEVKEKVLYHTFNDQFNQLQINLYDVPVYAVESLPSGRGNYTFDNFLTNGRL